MFASLSFLQHHTPQNTPEHPRQPTGQLPESQAVREQKKQVLKILRFVCEDLKIFKPRIPLPSPWIIRSLIDGVYLARGNLPFDEQLEWEKRVDHFLHELYALTRHPHAGKHWFREPDGDTPLFPNGEQFGPRVAAQFATAARHHLRDAHVHLI